MTYLGFGASSRMRGEGKLAAVLTEGKAVNQLATT